jgi:hypothetical protein
MQLNWGQWFPWGQTRAIANARSASTALSRARVEREDVELYLERAIEDRASAIPA